MPMALRRRRFPAQDIEIAVVRPGWVPGIRVAVITVPAGEFDARELLGGRKRTTLGGLRGPTKGSDLGLHSVVSLRHSGWLEHLGAGCAGDRIISGLPDEVCKQRSTSDRKIRESMRAHVRKDLDWTELCQRADNLAGDLTDALRLQIIEFASVLETFVIARLDFPAEQVETLPCVQEARSQGKLAGLQLQPPRIESSLRLST